MKSLKKWSLFLSICLMAILLATFSLLWVQNQVTVQSRYGQRLEEEFEAICQQIRNVNAQMAHIHSPKFLRKHYCKELSAPTASQVVWVSPSSHSEPKTFVTLHTSKASRRY